MSSKLPASPLEPRAQDGAPKKKKILVPKVENGHETMVEIEVDDVAGPEWGPREKLRLLNHEFVRVDAVDKVTGRARYTHDVRLAGMLYAKFVACPLPHAEVRVDLSAAKQVPGVVEARVVRDGEIRFVGQPVAVVAAKTREAAEDGARAIKLDLKPLPFAVTREQSLAANAPEVNRRGNASKPDERGDAAEVTAAFARCAAAIEATYSVPVQHHACLETHGAVVDVPSNDAATVYHSTQATFASAGEFKGPLKVSDVEVINEHMGGGFGSKFEAGVEGRVASELARDLKVPIHLMLSRKDEFLAAGNRSGCTATVKLGGTQDGKLVALSASVDRFGGLGGGSHAGLPYIYSVETSHRSMRSVYTHLDGNRAMRAPGHPQASFAMESALDELAYALGVDLVEIRKRNVGDVHAKQLERAAREIGWAEHPHKSKPDLSDAVVKVGIGFGLSQWGGGGHPECRVTVDIAPDGGVRATVGSQDLGTGVRTYVAAIVAEELGLPLGGVTARIGRTSYGPANASGGSVTTASLAPAVKHAAFNAKRSLLEALAKTLASAPDELVLDTQGVYDARSKRRLSWKDACATLPPAGISAVGEWQANLASNGVHGAQAAKVRVDTRTGEIQVVKMVCVQDCGLPLNRTGVRSQIFGGMIQALSYALFEERVIEPDLGLALNANFEDYKLAASREIPEMVAILDDDDTRGVIGMAEATIVPGHSAIANAIHNACGVRLRSMPLTCDKLLLGLAALKKG
ncbi:MAG: xanthine dehydrogenase family protein molybdopterin-binding subunit [Planctomycetes bacterium]|nr:xanthine dehydrogenase family protein molybdopterin-binding subunit [Planctomycetota bacterium]